MVAKGIFAAIVLASLLPQGSSISCYACKQNDAGCLQPINNVIRQCKDGERCVTTIVQNKNASWTEIDIVMKSCSHLRIISGCNDQGPKSVCMSECFTDLCNGTQRGTVSTSILLLSLLLLTLTLFLY